MIADTPGRGALISGVGDLIGLTLNAWLINMVLANGTVLYCDIYIKKKVSNHTNNLPQAQRATAFHFLTSKRFCAVGSTIIL